MTAASLQRANTSRSQLAVEIRGLSKSFGRTKALDGLDLTVAPGDITGFLGPNGAGKSTTVTVKTRGDASALQQLPYVHDFTAENGHVRFSADRNELDFVMEHLTDLGIAELTVTPASLEDLFLREYQGVTR